MQRHTSRPVTADRFDHAEGPGWDARTGQLLWVDQFAGHVHVGDHYPGADPEVVPIRSYELGSPVGAVVPSRALGGGWLVAAAHGFAHLAVDGTLTTLGQPEDGAPVRIRMNDGKCDDHGRFWAGSMAFDKIPGAGSLHRLDPDLAVSTVLHDVTISNGLAWTDGGETMYYIDTPTRQVDRFRVAADGRLHERTPVVRIADGAGEPDGMCIDDEGALWVALWDGWAVHRYSPDGTLLAVVEVDAPQVSSCCFGGPDGTTLFVTTSQEGMDPARRAEVPNSGRLFAAEVGMSGRPAAAFG